MSDKQNRPKKKQAAEAPWASEQRYRLLFDKNPDGVFAVDATGRFIIVNPACEAISGYSQAELLQKTFQDLCAPEQLERTLEHFGRSLRERVYLELETALIRKDGRRVELWVAGEALVEAGSAVAVQCTAKDITERKRAEKALRLAQEELVQMNVTLEQSVHQRTAQLKEANQQLCNENEQRERVEQELRASEQRFRNLVEASPDAIYISRDNQVVFVNPAALRLFGVTSPGQLLGQNPFRLFRPKPQSVNEGQVQQFLEAGKLLPPIEAQIMRRDGAVRNVDVVLCPFSDGGDTSLQVILHDTTECKLLEREILKALDLERQRLGRELHDGLCQWLTATKLRISFLERELERGHSVAPAEARALEGELNQAISQARAMSHALNPVNLVAQGLVFALENLAASLQNAGQLHCVCDCPQPVNIADPSTALHLYRIAQEAVQNALKHGQARNISIQLHACEDHLALVVLDDGIGFSPTAAHPPGMGIHNMKARASLMGGALTIESRPQGGTRVTCMLRHPPAHPGQAAR